MGHGDAITRGHVGVGGVGVDLASTPAGQHCGQRDEAAGRSRAGQGVSRLRKPEREFGHTGAERLCQTEASMEKSVETLEASPCLLADLSRAAGQK